MMLDVVNAERVSRCESWVVGADKDGGVGEEGEKPVMDQSTIVPSRSALERIRSW